VQLKPKWRNAAGMAMILLLIILWSIGVATLAPWISALPLAVQVVFYLVAGLAWIIPVKPLLNWTATGAWRRT
jgi:hypothetical protein